MPQRRRAEASEETGVKKGKRVSTVAKRHANNRRKLKPGFRMQVADRTTNEARQIGWPH